MRKILVFLISILISLASFSQISGNFKNFDPAKHSEIEISVFYETFTSNSQEEIKTTPDNQGNFEISLPKTDKPIIVYCKIPNYFIGSLVVHQGLELHLDANQKKQITFAKRKYNCFGGPDGEATAYFNRASTTNSLNFYTQKADLVFRSKDTLPNRLKQLDKIYAKHNKQLNSFIKKNPSEYAELIKDVNLALYYADVLTLYYNKPLPDSILNEIAKFDPFFTNYSTSNINQYLYYNLFSGNSIAYKNRIKEVVLQKISAEEHATFNTFFSEYEKRRLRQAYDKEIYASGKIEFLDKFNLDIYTAHLNAFIDTIKGNEIKNINAFLLSNIPASSDERLIYFAKITPFITAEWAVDLMGEIKQKDEDRLNQMLNMIVDTDETFALGELVGSNTSVQMCFANQDSLSEMLRAIQNHYPNKIVLLDIWGTWCGPCVSDIKKSKTKIEELKANNIEVVYLCEGNGSIMTTWQEKVLDYEMRGLQLFMSPVLTNQFLEKFKITGYPSHVIMDADGNFHLDDNHFIADLKLNDILKMVKE